MGRRLTLRRESLAELTTTDLGSVVGAAITPLCLPPMTGYSLFDCIATLRGCVYSGVDCITRGMGCVTDGCA